MNLINLLFSKQPGVGECPVDDGLEFIICEWFKLPPSDAEEWLFNPINEEPPKEAIDCCWCWLSSWSRGGDIGSDFILTGAGDDEEGGGVLLLTAKCGIALKDSNLLLAFNFTWSYSLPGVLKVS